MALRRLGSTRTADFTPLGSAGQRSFELIRREAAAISPAHEALFAEPSPSPKGDEVDWYANAAGPIRPLTAAPPAEQEAGKARLQELFGDIQGAADTLIRSNDPAKRRLGDAMRNAVEVPDEDCVYLVGDQPVIVAWAHHRNTTAPPTGVLATLAPRAAPLAPPITPIAEPAGGDTPPTEKSPRRRRWWWLVWTRTEVYTIRRGPTWGWLWWLLWITAGVLAALIAWVLLTACGTSWLIPLDYCPRAEVVAAVPEADRRDGLEAELYRLQRQLNQQDLACVPPPPAPVAEPPSNEFDTRVQQEGGQTNAALRITLIWDTLSDLDLHLYCPGGGHLFYRSRTACGGILDIDKNVRNPTNTPVENIVFTTSPPPGTYRIRVYNYTQVGRSTNNYKLQIVKNGEMSVKSGSLSRGGTGADFTFTVP